MSDFEEINDIVVSTTQSLAKREEKKHFIEDRWAVQDLLRERYEHLGIAKPRFVWAASPAAIYGAIEMLRQVQHGQTHNLVNAMVPMQSPVETSTRRTALTALIDPDITVTMGAALQKQIRALSGKAWHELIADGFLNALLAPKNLERKVGPARWEDAVVYSSQCGFGRFDEQLFCMCPYTKIVWLCQPAERQGDDLVFQDGFVISLEVDTPLHKRIARANSQARLSLPWGSE